MDVDVVHRQKAQGACDAMANQASLQPGTCLVPSWLTRFAPLACQDDPSLSADLLGDNNGMSAAARRALRINVREQDVVTAAFSSMVSTLKRRLRGVVLIVFVCPLGGC
jgi:hypothetical protein